jgi:quinol monooxygenase YgiN
MSTPANIATVIADSLKGAASTTPAPAAAAPAAEVKPAAATKAASSMAELARNNMAKLPTPGEAPATPAPAAPEDGEFTIEESQFPDHPAFKGLVKPDGSAGKGAQFKYLKDRNKAWEAYAADQAGEAARRGGALTEREKRLAEIDAELASAKERLAAVPEIEGRAKTAEERLALLDLQHDPDFIRKFGEPVTKLEASVSDTLDLAGSSKGLVISKLNEAIRAKDNATFVAAALDAMNGLIPESAHPMVIRDLRDLRALYAERDAALARHPSMKDVIATERASRRRSEAESYMTKDFAEMTRTMGNTAHGLHEMLKQEGVIELLKPHQDALDKMRKQFPEIVRSTVEKVGHIGPELMGYAILGQELLPSVFLMSEMFREHQEMQAELKDLKAAAALAESRSRGRQGDPRPGSGGGTPGVARTMGELATQRLNENS